MIKKSAPLCLLTTFILSLTLIPEILHADINSATNLVDEIVGQIDSNNSLTIANTGTTFTVNANSLSIGDNTGANSNSTTVSGATLIIAENLTLGTKGSFNSFSANNGSSILTDSAIIGEEASSSGNIALIENISSWSNSTSITVGQNGSSNTLEINNGGLLDTASFYAGQNNSTNNTILVTGTDSSLHTSNAIINGKSSLIVGNGALVHIGSGSASNASSSSLVVSDKGVLDIRGQSSIQSSYGILGLNSNESGTVSISDTGSVWKVDDTLTVGEYGTNNTLIIVDQAAVTTDYLNLGMKSGATSNKITLTESGTLTVSNAVTFGEGEYNSINIDNGAVLSARSVNTGPISNNLINVNNGGQLQLTGNADLTTNNINFESGAIVRAGGTLVIEETIEDGRTIIIDGSLSTNIASITTSELNLGGAKNGNKLHVENGGRISLSGNLTSGDTSSQNEFTINGTDSTASISGNIKMGNKGSENTLSITNGAKANIGGSVSIGYDEIAIGNALLVSGNGSSLTITNNLTIGANGSDNEGKIFNGGSVTNIGDIAIGTASSASGNSLLVSGNNSTLTALSAQINADGKENSLTISDGGRADISNAVTLGGKGIDGALTVTGNNSVLSAALATADGKGNTLKAENNGAILLGAMDTSSIPTFEGGIIAVSSSNTLATLSITNGASTESDQGLIGIASNETGMVTISGSKSKWDTQNLQVGVHGSSNVLSIIDGGTITASNVVVGSNAEATDNSISITGMDSKLTTDFLSIGTSNNIGNKVNVGDGALLTIGETLSFNTNNTLNIKNGGTLSMENDFNLYDAETNGFNFNSGATLQVGGTLTATNSIEGGRHIALTGTNASWDTGSNLIVGGGTSSSNTFSLLDGAQLNLTNITVGATATAHNNSLNVSDKALLVTDTILIGMEGSTNNTLNITDGGSVQINDSFSVSSNNFVNLNGGNLINTGNFDAKMASNLSIGSNSTLTVGGTLSINTNEFRIRNGGTIKIDGKLNDNLAASWEIDSLYLGGTNGTGSLSVTNGGEVITTYAYIGDTTDSSSATISGTDSLWSISSDLKIGSSGGNSNSLYITDGGTVSATNGIIGDGTSFDNKVQVSGVDSFFHILNDLTIDGANLLKVMEGGSVVVNNDLRLQNNSTLHIDENSTVNVTNNYTQDGTSTLFVKASHDSSGSLIVGNTADFKTDAKVWIINSGKINTNRTFKHIIVSAGNLQFGGETASTNNMESNIDIDLQGSLYSNAKYSVENNKLIIEGDVRALSSVLGFESETQLANVADEIDDLGTQNISEADNMRSVLGKVPEAGAVAMDNYYGEKSSSSPANNAINLGLQNIANQLTMRADNTRSRSGAASAAINWNKLQGAAGPHEPDQELQGWISAYGSKGKQDGSSGFNGYDTRVGGFMVGADFTVSDNILLGVAGGSGTASVDKDNDSSSDSKTTYVAIYASAGTESWFMDSSLIYGNTSIDSTLGSTFDTTADYDAKNMAFYFGGGKEIAGDYLIFTPQASLLGNYYKQNAYTEDATTAVAREVDSFDAFYLQSSLGASMGMYVGLGDVTLKPELRMHWLHEWNAKEEDLGFSLIGGANDYTMLLQAPEEDILKIGIGTSAKLGEFLELRADLDARLGADYSDTTLLGSIRYQF